MTPSIVGAALVLTVRRVLGDELVPVDVVNDDPAWWRHGVVGEESMTCWSRGARGRQGAGDAIRSMIGERRRNVGQVAGEKISTTKDLIYLRSPMLTARRVLGDEPVPVEVHENTKYT